MLQQKPATDFCLQLSEYKAAIDVAINEELKVYLSSKNSLVSNDSFEAIKILADFVNAPAKRIRSALVWETYKALCPKPDLLTGKNLAISLELIQDYLLIVDDVMDRSSFRRGESTVHQKYYDKFVYLVEPARSHVSNMMAINVGLLAQHLANQLILSCPTHNEYIKKTLEIMHENIVRTCYGQIDDILYINKSDKPDTNMVNSIYEAKSSYYTFINPILMGAAMAGEYSESLSESVVNFGLPAGLAFQLQDDLLGMFGDSNKTGKPNMDDLREGKWTLLVVYALELANDKDKAKIIAELGNPNLISDNFLSIRNIIEACGAKAKVEQEAELATKKALALLESSPWINQRLKDFYKGVIKYSINRKW
jgi:geranylgeranyl diphosphate synthase, type I